MPKVHYTVQCKCCNPPRNLHPKKLTGHVRDSETTVLRDAVRVPDLPPGVLKIIKACISAKNHDGTRRRVLQQLAAGVQANKLKL
jgi:hypothetical protein